MYWCMEDPTCSREEAFGSWTEFDEIRGRYDGYWEDMPDGGLIQWQTCSAWRDMQPVGDMLELKEGVEYMAKTGYKIYDETGGDLKREGFGEEFGMIFELAMSGSSAVALTAGFTTLATFLAF